jgi:hypothetical protein
MLWALLCCRRFDEQVVVTPTHLQQEVTERRLTCGMTPHPIWA